MVLEVSEELEVLEGVQVELARKKEDRNVTRTKLFFLS